MEKPKESIYVSVPEEYVRGIFKTNKDIITTFDGCHSVELLRDINTQNIFFTYSTWDSENSLNRYRESNTFKDIWSKTKPLFSNKAKAWSLEEI